MFRGNVAAQEILAGRGSAGDDRQKLHEKDDYPGTLSFPIDLYQEVLLDAAPWRKAGSS